MQNQYDYVMLKTIRISYFIIFFVMLLIIIGPILVITLLVLIGMYNSIISTKNKVAESFSAIDTVLQNRYDLIPNLVEVVKQYASHEA